MGEQSTILSPKPFIYLLNKILGKPHSTVVYGADATVPLIEELLPTGKQELGHAEKKAF